MQSIDLDYLLMSTASQRSIHEVNKVSYWPSSYQGSDLSKFGVNFGI